MIQALNLEEIKEKIEEIYSHAYISKIVGIMMANYHSIYKKSILGTNKAKRFLWKKD